jgi:hypothetical protein
VRLGEALLPLQRGVRARQAEHGDVVQEGHEDAVGVLGRHLLLQRGVEGQREDEGAEGVALLRALAAVGRQPLALEVERARVLVVS